MTMLCIMREYSNVTLIIKIELTSQSSTLNNVWSLLPINVAVMFGTTTFNSGVAALFSSADMCFSVLLLFYMEK